MSFDTYKQVIEENDTVILYLNPSSMYAIKVKPTVIDKLGKTVDNVFQTTYGALKINNLIGKEFGSKVTLSKGWAFILYPTPELWTLTLPHRTQIIYSPDISMIVMQLDIHPGSIVVESGTGSGSLSHALARTVSPSGHVYTFDFHKQRVSVAEEEFSAHGLIGCVTVSQRDVCSEGFGPGVEGRADAVFLDLPHPWLVIEHAVKAIKNTGGRFCSFSPCIEQVQKTCEGLHSAGFTEVETLECLRRDYSVHNRSFRDVQPDQITCEQGNSKKCQPQMITMPCMVLPPSMPGHTGYLTCASLPPDWARVVPQAQTSEDSNPQAVEPETN